MLAENRLRNISADRPKFLDVTMIHCTNPQYLQKILTMYGVSYETLGELCLIHGHSDYNNLIKVNGVFSGSPRFWPVDRTQTILPSLRLSVYDTWSRPRENLDLAESLRRRVIRLLESGKMCNILWSGGIDSTTMLTAFLKFSNNIDQIRVLYSPWSTYEHPGYIEWLSNSFPRLDLVDISGDVYIDQEFDGLLITGEGGDESMASIDASFYSGIDHHELHAPWREYFHKRLSPADHSVIDFFERFCQGAQRDIHSLLEARWWFYITCKIDSLLRERKIHLLSMSDHQVSIDRLVAFFDCSEFAAFVYHNIDSIIDSPGYRNWKRPLKKFCFDYDGFRDWYEYKSKFNSIQILKYYCKKNILKDQRWLLILSDGHVITTPNLPFINHRELENHHPNLIALLLNDSIQI